MGCKGGVNLDIELAINKRPVWGTFGDRVLEVGLKICIWLKYKLKINYDIENNIKI